ncbi:MAG TPA: hypothetical protein VGV38_05570, partial [Pyrinomonadaceae bacterium]|nr:hypothetical protein [Pyrinomonadaceae bacterium]
MKAFRLSSARPLAFVALALLFATAARLTAEAQTLSPTPDTFTAQVTNGSTADSFAYGISGNGRFVVIESTANLAPENPLAPTTGRNNADGNREIFLFDYAQRRIFQITNTRDALVNPANPRVPTDAIRNFSNIAVEVSNHRPAISYDGKWIVFASNAGVDGTANNPGDFNGSSFTAQLQADGNVELWLYRVPDVPDVDLTQGTEVAPVSLVGGAFTRVTTSSASLPPKAGGNQVPPEIADDNRFPSINDDGSVVAFISSRNLLGGTTNSDLNAELFVFRRTGSVTQQLTSTANPTNSAVNLVYQTNPSLSADGNTVAFVSTADFGLGAEPADARGGAEVFVSNISGGSLTNLRQVTRTPNDALGNVVNLMSYGRRLSRDGRFLLFETRAALGATGTAEATLQDSFAVYLYAVDANSFRQVGPRAAAAFGRAFDAQRHPTFTGDNATILFGSTLNFRADGTAPPTPTGTEGLNPGLSNQLFATPVANPTTFSRLTNAPGNLIPFEIVPQAAETVKRVSFSYRGELGGGRTNAVSEVFYTLTPTMTSSADAAALSFLTGASLRPVAAPSPAPSPSPTPGETVLGVSPGMLVVARSTTVPLSPATREIDETDADERARRPPLPIELNGVSVSVNGAAAGLYFVSPTQINFVVPPGVAPSTTPATVVIHASNGAILRTTLLIIFAQPDLFTTANGPGGRAVALNVTNPCLPGTGEPAGGFPIQSSRPTGGVCTATTTENVPTELMFLLTGVRNVTA